MTTIFSPTDDVKFLAEIPGWKVVIVGDKKTPLNWRCVQVLLLKQLAKCGSGVWATWDGSFI